MTQKDESVEFSDADKKKAGNWALKTDDPDVISEIEDYVEYIASID